MRTRREEEIAFLVMEQVLGVDIQLADANGADKMPDGVWVSRDGQTRCIVEITSPPADRLMAKWAKAKREGRPQAESGSIPLRRNELADVCVELLATDWAVGNINKLQAQRADERHLFLFGRGHYIQHYFCRLSDPYEDGSPESVSNLVLPDGISDVWFRGRAPRKPGQLLGPIEVYLARYSAGPGWQRYVVEIEEQDLPSPASGIADDPVPARMRHTKDRTTVGVMVDP
ncbi:hypothetical protein [Clavibacter tessellarius]|uniref:hypothetical protein n=1 Tax=Clavibacter tessellarius TaxID=31965 RepID=UPI00104242FC|nr:hypothetical protein [Clavibacter michiganensis]